jgi:hypothetical protein
VARREGGAWRERGERQSRAAPGRRRSLPRVEEGREEAATFARCLNSIRAERRKGSENLGGLIDSDAETSIPSARHASLGAVEEESSKLEL